MLLAIDIGNTNIAMGVFAGKKLLKPWKVKSDREKTCDEYKILLMELFSLGDIKASEINEIIISSVVPPLTPVFQSLSRDLFKIRAMVVGPGLKTGLSILYEHPAEVGADRIVASLAAFEKFGGPAVVVDFGTATTFDAVSGQGEYLGGAIAPGIQSAAESLYLKTAKLPRIEIIKPKQAVGRTTVASMQSGLYFGYAGLVAKIIAVIKNEIGKNAKVVVTGGFASLILPELDDIAGFEPFLVLEGLRIMHEKNRS
ncbi:MAG: type III pantothenate kinase [Candidatus Aminicenantes bacterium]|nr:type III pantothenate kinase [Candidatus Aminicenantes bacterium]